MIFMPFLVETVIAPKFVSNPEKFDLTVLLTRIMFPYLAAMSLVAMLSGILNAFRRYFLAALAPVIMNIVPSFVCLLTEHKRDWKNRELGIAMAWGVFASGILQALLLVIGILKEGISAFPAPAEAFTKN